MPKVRDLRLIFRARERAAGVNFQELQVLCGLLPPDRQPETGRPTEKKKTEEGSRPETPEET